MSKIMTWHIWEVTYLCRNVTIVCGTSYHLLGSRISQDLKIRFRLQIESYISDWRFSELRHSARYASHHNAMAYDRHMDIKYHFLVKWVECNLLQLEWIDISMNLADHFTKQLGRTLFHRHVDYILGKVPPPYSCAYDRFRSGLHKDTSTTPPVQKPACSPLPNKFTAVAAHLWTSWSRVIGSIL